MFSWGIPILVITNDNFLLKEQNLGRVLTNALESPGVCIDPWHSSAESIKVSFTGTLNKVFGLIYLIV